MNTTFPPLDGAFPSSIPPFRVLVEILTQCQQTGTPMNCAAPELRDTDQVLGQLQEAFTQALVGQDLTPDEDEDVADALEAFAGLRERLESLHASVEENDLEVTVQAVEAAAEHLRALEGALARLREAEARRPVYSLIPSVNGLIRSGRAVLEERLGWDALAARLEALLPVWEALAGREDTPPEVAAHGQVLEDLARVVAEEDLEALGPLLESLRLTGEALPVARARVDAPPEPAGVSCPRCGAPVGEWDRACPSCGGRMPERVGEAPEVTAVAEPVVLPEYLQALFLAAEGLRTGEGGWDSFHAAVAELRRRATQALAFLERVPSPPQNAPADELEAWHSAQEAVENGLEKFFEGLEDLESLASEPDSQVLARGLEAVSEAVRETRQVGVAMQRLLEGRANSEQGSGGDMPRRTPILP